MPTVNQLIRKPRQVTATLNKDPAMQQNPQKRSVSKRDYTTTPKSRTRLCVRLRRFA